MNGFERKTHSNKLDKRSPKISELVLHTYAVNRSQSSFSGMHTGYESEQVITALPPYYSRNKKNLKKKGGLGKYVHNISQR